VRGRRRAGSSEDVLTSHESGLKRARRSGRRRRKLRRAKRAAREMRSVKWVKMKVNSGE
jgi:hypothetical protein